MNSSFQTKIGDVVHLGKLEKVEDDRNLKLARYFTPDLGPPPVSVVRSPTVEAGLGAAGWGMMKNDAYGDCTCAALGHASQTWSVLVGKKPHTPSDDAVFKLYIPDTGSDDTGRSEYEVLKYVKKHGLFHHKVYAFAEVGLQSFDYVKHAVDLFGLSYIGLALPRSAQGQSVWSVVTGPDSEPGSWGGHAVIVLDYDATGITCITWGEKIKMEWAFFARYCDEAYVLISSEWFNRGKTIAGFNRNALIADLDALA